MTKFKSTKKTYRTTFTLSNEMYKNAILKSQTLGLNLNEYIRHLIAQDSQITDASPTLSSFPKLTNKNRQNIERAFKQFEKHNTHIISNKNDIKNLLENKLIME